MLPDQVICREVAGAKDFELPPAEREDRAVAGRQREIHGLEHNHLAEEDWIERHAEAKGQGWWCWYAVLAEERLLL